MCPSWHAEFELLQRSKLLFTLLMSCELCAVQRYRKSTETSASPRPKYRNTSHSSFITNTSEFSSNILKIEEVMLNAKAD